MDIWLSLDLAFASMLLLGVGQVFQDVQLDAAIWCFGESCT